MMADGNANMPNGNGHGALSRMVKTEFTQGLSRALIVFGVPLILAMGGFIGTRVMNQIDDQGHRIEHQGTKTRDTLDEQARAIDLLRQAMEFRRTQRDGEIVGIKGMIADHETRIRGLERPGGLMGPR